jgi:hypothetical protein
MVMPSRAAVQVQEREGPPRRSSPEFGKMKRIEIAEKSFCEDVFV